MNEEFLREQYQESNFERRANGLPMWHTFEAFREYKERMATFFETLNNENAMREQG